MRFARRSEIDLNYGGQGCPRAAVAVVRRIDLFEAFPVTLGRKARRNRAGPFFGRRVPGNCSRESWPLWKRSVLKFIAHGQITGCCVGFYTWPASTATM